MTHYYETHPQFKPWFYAVSGNTTIQHGLNRLEDGTFELAFDIPSFQRPLVWTLEQKVRFIESVWGELPIGSYVYCASSDHDNFELLDGQQRWNAILSYMNSEFQVYDLLFSELPADAQRVFRNGRAFPSFRVDNPTEEEKLDIYNRLAYGGTAHEVPSHG